MPLPDQMDMATAYSFSVKIDGVEVPYVIEVSGLKSEVDMVTYQEQAQDGKYVSRQVMGRPKPGQFTVTRGLTDSTTVTEWLKAVMQGDLAGARKTAEVAVYSSDNSPVKRTQLPQLLDQGRRGRIDSEGGFDRAAHGEVHGRMG